MLILCRRRRKVYFFKVYFLWTTERKKVVLASLFLWASSWWSSSLWRVKHLHKGQPVSCSWLIRWIVLRVGPRCGNHLWSPNMVHHCGGRRECLVTGMWSVHTHFIWELTTSILIYVWRWRGPWARRRDGARGIRCTTEIDVSLFVMPSREGTKDTVLSFLQHGTLAASM